MIYRLLAQAAPASGNFYALYTCNSGNALINNVRVCNRNTGEGNFQILIYSGGVTGSPEQFLADLNINSKDVYSAVEGWIIRLLS